MLECKSSHRWGTFNRCIFRLECVRKSAPTFHIFTKTQPPCYTRVHTRVFFTQKKTHMFYKKYLFITKIIIYLHIYTVIYLYEQLCSNH